ncbi:unnamed protein product [Blepharisma stoltei]|uniref:CCHC-type domain-containing protein n=1 Tax=Blepharisma stoltei TaxID=1481888 RepID=A0AAU9KCT7_9CILI|nr:unnamed protein product [Blepharisma stoltei]
MDKRYSLFKYKHNSTLMEGDRLRRYLDELPEDNKYKLIYMSMTGFIAIREKEKRQKESPNCCRKCGDSKHITERCPICYFCDDYGHTKNNCPRRRPYKSRKLRKIF